MQENFGKLINILSATQKQTRHFDTLKRQQRFGSSSDFFAAELFKLEVL